MQWKKRVKEYFSFTLKERIGIVVLIVLVFVIFILPGMIHGNKNWSRIEAEEINALAKTLNNVSLSKREYSDNNENNNDNKETNTKEYSLKKPAELFYFNPNTASKEEWTKLGVREKTVRTILNYLSKGGHFYKAEDLKKIYGLHDDLVEQLIPFVKLPEHSQAKKFARHEQFEKQDRQYLKKEFQAPVERKRFIILDVNKADSADFESLPGIGSKLAGRIVHFRERLGGFYSLDQVGETYGLSDSTFKLILPNLRLSEAKIRRIYINKSDVYVLKAHPYIGWQVANILVRYRQQHGEFKSVEAIREIGGISTAVAIKLLPYLSID